MIARRRDDRLPPLHAITCDNLRRRRPRHSLDSQPGRCPLCNRVMSAYVGAQGPRYHCGCDETNGANGHNGNGH
jgi:hypothetical protein